jgi:hypothetical protein
MSALLPGAGQFFLEQFLASSLFLAAYATTWLCFVVLRLPKSFAGLLGLLFVSPVLVIWAVLHAAYSRIEDSQRISKWWIPALLCLAFATTYLHLNLPDRIGGFRPFEIPSTSMEPTILLGDHVLLDMHYYHGATPSHGDIVVFRREGLYIVKRVIAVEEKRFWAKINKSFSMDTSR